MKILKNLNTGEERPLIRCGITRCDKVIHIGDEMGYDKNYDVFCEGCSSDLFVARGEINDDWISGDIGWEEVEENKTNDEGVCKNCDQLTPRSDLREYRRDIYFCSRCLEDYTLESQEGGA